MVTATLLWAVGVSIGKALGLRGKEYVRKHFLTPRYLRDYLTIFTELLEGT